MKTILCYGDNDRIDITNWPIVPTKSDKILINNKYFVAAETYFDMDENEIRIFMRPDERMPEREG